MKSQYQKYALEWKSNDINANNTFMYLCSITAILLKKYFMAKDIAQEHKFDSQYPLPTKRLQFGIVLLKTVFFTIPGLFTETFIS